MRATKDYFSGVTGAALLVNGCIPVALSNSEGAGSVRALVRLPGAHLYIQVLGNEITKRLRAGPSHPLTFRPDVKFMR